VLAGDGERVLTMARDIVTEGVSIGLGRRHGCWMGLDAVRCNGLGIGEVCVLVGG